MAPIGLKLGQNAFQTIPNISFFDTEKICSVNFFVKIHDFRNFGQVFDELRIFGRQWQILHEK